MKFSIFSSNKDLIIVTSKKILHTRLQFDALFFDDITLKSFASFDQLFANIDKCRDILLIINNDIAFEAKVELESFLSDETIIKPALKAKLHQNKTIHLDVLFHYKKQNSKLKLENQKYKLFGFYKNDFNEILDAIPYKNSLHTVTTPQYLLFNYCCGFLNKEFIVLYRFRNEDILIVSDGQFLLFSTTRFSEKIDIRKSVLSVEYVLQHFEKYSFTLYLSGEFLEKNHIASFNKAISIPIKTLKKSNSLLYLKGFAKLPKIFNFTPKKFLIKKSFKKIINTFIVIILLLFFVSLTVFALKYSNYKKELVSYGEIKKNYDTQLKSLKLIDAKPLHQFLQLQRLSHMEYLRYFEKILDNLTLKITKTMLLQDFVWNIQKNRSAFKIIFFKRFANLLKMDDFILFLSNEIKLMQKRFPYIKFKSFYDFKSLTISFKITSKKIDQNNRLYQKSKY